MKTWRLLLAALLLALVAAGVWYALAGDPGDVQVRIGETVFQSTALVAAFGLLLAWLVVTLVWKLIQWPFVAFLRRTRRRGRAHLASGLVAYAEGDYAVAERDLAKAAKVEVFRTPATLARARAAQECGACDRALAALDTLGDDGSRAADALKARFLLDAGRGHEALALLKARANEGKLSPRGWRLLADTALAHGDTPAALDAVAALAKTPTAAPEAIAALETRTLAAALRSAPDAGRLNALWSAASRVQRQRPELVEAYARRAAGCGQALAAMGEIEAAQRRGWSDALALAYGELGSEEVPARLRTLESWLARAPNSPALHTALARLHGLLGHWSQAEESLRRALAFESTPSVWETWGDLRSAQNDAAGAGTAYANALRAQRGEAVRPLDAVPARGALDTRPVAFEERSEHGLPRLSSPGA